MLRQKNLRNVLVVEDDQNTMDIGSRTLE